MSSIVAAYSGSFDPITLGHNDIMHRAAPRCAPKLIMCEGEERFFSVTIHPVRAGGRS
ncbi:hypothetical protein DFR24_0911 [Panacagrimonas perspica]|uniref:Cytidyltransferase-like domain-containing protein n=1 Tax=Panacagrimonas perspica TaxID=381431 RepID=A0A4R7PDC2_9GAMM|nr:hypothetical protein [Panacagrimonas perspica]TDU31541.1 hypothetical protein DFR24_0911 [Panacagrimonas perspica]